MHIEFTTHARDRMRKRSISEDEVINAITYPEGTQKIGEVYYVYKKLDRFVLRVVYVRENYIKVLTLFPS